ncbi:MAG: type IV pilus assembly protein PilM [bacterium]|nr:type IV pilus assembly protein PilM [bacterium]
MLQFLSLKPETFGLDISDLSLKIIKLGRDLNLESIGESPIKPGIIKEGIVKNEKGLAEIIKKAVAGVEKGKIKTKNVIASLPEEKAFLQVIQMPLLSKEDLKSAVIFESENYIPLPIEEVYLDSQIIPPLRNHLDHYDVLIAAIPRKIVDPYVSSLELAGLVPTVLEIESLAIARSLIKAEKTESPILIVDLGATRTSFIIFSGHSIRFTASIPISSQGFTQSISQSMKVDLNKAEELKIKYGIETRAEKKGGEVFDALIPAITDLMEQIKKHLDYYQSHASHEHLAPNGKWVEKILLCGGGSNLRGLPEFLSEELRAPIEFGNPWVNILPRDKKTRAPLPFEKSLSFATALGLALRGLEKEDD